MPKNIEFEAKALLKKSDYENLINNYLEDTYVQTNYYIDYSDLSLSKRFGIRIREKNKTFELTIKIKNKDNNLEINQNISKNQFNNFKENNIFPKGEVFDKLIDLNVNISLLKIFGSITTSRKDIKFKNCLISIDKSEYNNVMDYEIECESSSLENASKALMEFLNENGIEFEFNTITKLQRLLNSIR